MPVTWYLNVDMHLYIISPILLFALWKFGYKCMPVIITLVLYSMYQSYQISVQNEFNLAMVLDFPAVFTIKMYTPVYIRFASWLIGVTLGYIFYSKREKPSQISTVSRSTSHIKYIKNLLKYAIFSTNVLVFGPSL